MVLEWANMAKTKKVLKILGGVPEIIDSEKIGYLIQSNDHIELAKRMEQ